MRCLGSSPCQAPGADDAALHVGSDTRSTISRWIRFSRLPPARGCIVRGTIDRCARKFHRRTLSLFGCRCRGRRDRPLSFAQRPLAQTIGLTDAQLSEHIYSDKIDVLVDLAGHSAGNRLLTFARRPAPVQVAYLLGHGYSTGMLAMDAFLADSHLAPAGADALFSERLIRLPRIPLAYAPPDGMPLVTALPALSNGYVTFGHFGRTERLNDMVIATWARHPARCAIIAAGLDNRPFQEPAFREQIPGALRPAWHRARKTRSRLQPPQPRVWAAYGGIDIALDPFPHNAGTTTIEALWQGVRSSIGRAADGRSVRFEHPARGRTGRLGCRYDRRLREASIGRGVRPPSLAQMRQDLRKKSAASPLCDAAGLARAIEATYRMLWDEWREGDVPRLHRLYTQGHHNEATELASRMLRRDEAAADAHHVLGLLAYHGNRQIEADSHLRAAIECAPAQAELHANHAAILRKAGRLADAESAARSALTLEPERVSAHNNLGNILRDAGRYDESAGCYRAAVRLSPDFVDAWVNLAWVLALAGHARQAEEAARQAIACDTRNPDAHNNLGLALMRQGRLAEAEAALRQALALRPERALPHSNILFCLNYRVDVSAEEIFAEYRRWDIQHAQPLMPARQTSTSIGRRTDDCALVTFPPISASTRSPCLRNPCSPRMTVPWWKCIAMRKCRHPMPSPSGFVPFPITGTALSV